MNPELVSSHPSQCGWNGVLPIGEITQRLQLHINERVNVILDNGVSWRKKTFKGVLEKIGTEGITVRLLNGKKLDIPYHESEDGMVGSPGINKIFVGNHQLIYERVGISYYL